MSVALVAQVFVGEFNIANLVLVVHFNEQSLT
jgi:hypothetical protein